MSDSEVVPRVTNKPTQMEQTTVNARRSVRQRLYAFMESHFMHKILIGLLVFDVCILFVEHLILIIQLQELNYACSPANKVPIESAEESWTKPVELALHIMTMVVVSIFMLELILKLVSAGWGYLRYAAHVADSVIIIAAFVGEIVIPLYAEGIVFLLLPLRIFRLMRLTYTMAEVTKEEMNAHHHIVEHEL
jgi:voltage-gated hydrogen channel 1